MYHRPVRIWLVGLVVAAFFICAVMAASVTYNNSAQAAEPSSSHVIALIERRNQGLSSYAAAAHLDLRQVNFPWLHPVLDGTQYFTAPGYSHFDFPDAPRYLRGMTSGTAAVGEVDRWSACYNITVFDDRSAYRLRLRPKRNGQVAEMNVTVDKADGSVPQVIWTYVDSSDHVSLEQFYQIVNGYSVVVEQKTEVLRHHIHAYGDVTFSQFHFNVAVPGPTPTPADLVHHCDN